MLDTDKQQAPAGNGCFLPALVTCRVSIKAWASSLFQEGNFDLIK